MVGCVIKCPLPPSSPSCQSRQRDDYSLMPRRQGNEISRSPLALSLFPSQPLRGRSPKQEETFLFFYFYCNRLEHFGLGLRSTYSIVWAESLAKI